MGRKRNSTRERQSGTAHTGHKRSAYRREPTKTPKRPTGKEREEKDKRKAQTVPEMRQEKQEQDSIGEGHPRRDSLKNPYGVRGRQTEQKDELQGKSEEKEAQGAREDPEESMQEKSPGKNGENGSRTAGKKTPTEQRDEPKKDHA